MKEEENRLFEVMDIEHSEQSALDELLASPFEKSETQEADKPKAVSKKVIDLLPAQHKKKAMELAAQIDVNNHQSILQFGVPAQAELSKFSEVMLQHVKNSDTTPVGQVIKELMEKISEIDPAELEKEQKGLFQKIVGSLFKGKNDLYKKYQRIDLEIEKISDHLEGHRKALLKDNIMLNKYFEKNRDYFDALNVYIAAAEYKLEELTTKTLPALKEKALQYENQMYAQEVSDLQDFIVRLEKRIHDLQLSRQIALQSAPQIRMIQQTNQALVEKIQSSVLTTIPLWKNQVAITVAMGRQKQAIEAQKHVSQTTNELLKRNAEMLRTNSIEAAKENERGIVDIETLKHTQKELMITLEETLKIQEEGRNKRREAENSLLEMEQEMKNFLLELKTKEHNS